MPLTPNETKLLIKFVRDLEDRFSSNGCNDFELPDTPENREISRWSWIQSQGSDEDYREMISGGKIHCNNGIILYGLRKKLEQV